MTRLARLHALLGRKKLTHCEKKMVDDQGNISRIITSYNRTVEPPYVKIYDESLPLLQKLSFTSIGFLLDLVFHATYRSGMDAVDSGILDLNARIRKQFLEKHGLSNSRFQGILRQLIDADAIVRLSRGSYQVNPAIFARGQWRDICVAGDMFAARLAETRRAEAERKRKEVAA